MIRATMLALLTLGFTVGSLHAAPPSPAQTLEASTDVLDDLSAIPLRGIPPALLADAHGVAIIPHVIKAGFIVGGRGGHGVVLARGKDGTWGNPTFVHIGGASVGFQAGVQATDVVLVFRSRKSLDRILEGKGKVTLGADAAIAAGPIGRQAMAGTDAKLEAEIVSYSRSRGVFAGVSLDGAALVNDTNSNAEFARDTRPEIAKLADQLRKRLTEMSTVAPQSGPVSQPTPVPPLPPPVMVPAAPMQPLRPVVTPAQPLLPVAPTTPSKTVITLPPPVIPPR